MENYYAKSVILGRKSSGTFFGLKYENKSKHYKMQITAVCWQTWAVDIIDADTEKPVDRFTMKQSGEKTPSLELSDSRFYKKGYHYEASNCEMYSA